MRAFPETKVRSVKDLSVNSQYFVDHPILWSLPLAANLAANLHIYKNVSDSSGPTEMTS